MIAVFISNIPESFSSTAEFERAGRSRRRSSPSGPGSPSPRRSPPALGYEFLGGASENVQAGTQAFAGGAILTMLATEMMPTAFEDSGKSIAIGLVTVLGFALAAGLTAIE